jgi:hypothetical protein
MAEEKRPHATGPAPGEFYEVFASTPFHLSGEGERYRVGGFPDCASARAACQRIVDDFLAASYREDMLAEELLRIYQESGHEPFIQQAGAGPEECLFRAAEYAANRAGELCGRR